MRTSIRSCLLLMVASMVPASAAAQAGEYTIDARNPSSIFHVALDPGLWSVGLVGGAWNAWGTATGCDASGMNCSTGWFNYFSWALNGDPFSSHGQSMRYESQALAFANRLDPFELSISAPSTLTLRILDDPYTDNLGTMTVGVGQVAAEPSITPEPATLILLGSGLAGLAAIRRRRRNESGA